MILTQLTDQPQLSGHSARTLYFAVFQHLWILWCSELSSRKKNH